MDMLTLKHLQTLRVNIPNVCQNIWIWSSRGKSAGPEVVSHLHTSDRHSHKADDFPQGGYSVRRVLTVDLGNTENQRGQD